MALPGLRPAFRHSNRTKYPKATRKVVSEIGADRDVLSGRGRDPDRADQRDDDDRLGDPLHHGVDEHGHEPRPQTGHHELEGTPSGVAATNRSSISTRERRTIRRRPSGRLVRPRGPGPAGRRPRGTSVADRGAAPRAPLPRRRRRSGLRPAPLPRCRRHHPPAGPGRPGPRARLRQGGARRQRAPLRDHPVLAAGALPGALPGARRRRAPRLRRPRGAVGGAGARGRRRHPRRRDSTPAPTPGRAGWWASPSRPGRGWR